MKKCARTIGGLRLLLLFTLLSAGWGIPEAQATTVGQPPVHTSTKRAVLAESRANDDTMSAIGELERYVEALQELRERWREAAALAHAGQSEDALRLLRVRPSDILSTRYKIRQDQLRWELSDLVKAGELDPPTARFGQCGPARTTVGRE